MRKFIFILSALTMAICFSGIKATAQNSMSAEMQIKVTIVRGGTVTMGNNPLSSLQKERQRNSKVSDMKTASGDFQIRGQPGSRVTVQLPEPVQFRGNNKMLTLSSRFLSDCDSITKGCAEEPKKEGDSSGKWRSFELDNINGKTHVGFSLTLKTAGKGSSTDKQTSKGVNTASNPKYYTVRVTYY